MVGVKADEMAQGVRVVATKSDDPSSIPGTDLLEMENFGLPLTHYSMCNTPPPHTHTQNK